MINIADEEAGEALRRRRPGRRRFKRFHQSWPIEEAIQVVLEAKGRGCQLHTTRSLPPFPNGSKCAPYDMMVLREEAAAAKLHRLLRSEAISGGANELKLILCFK